MQWEESGNLKQAALGGQVSDPVEWKFQYICVLFL
jgi:hypothetical protein